MKKAHAEKITNDIKQLMTGTYIDSDGEESGFVMTEQKQDNFIALQSMVVEDGEDLNMTGGSKKGSSINK